MRAIRNNLGIFAKRLHTFTWSLPPVKSNSVGNIAKTSNQNHFLKYFLAIIFLSLIISGCFQTSQIDKQNTPKVEISETPKENIIRNFLAYSDIKIGDVLDKYDNIESIKIQDASGRNSVFITGDSVYNSRSVRMASTSDKVKILVKLNSGESISLFRR